MKVFRIVDKQGNQVGALGPIDLWRETKSERETAYLLKSPAMKQRLVEAKERQSGIPFEQALERLAV